MTEGMDSRFHGNDRRKNGNDLNKARLQGASIKNT